MERNRVVAACIALLWTIAFWQNLGAAAIGFGLAMGGVFGLFDSEREVYHESNENE